MLQNLRNYFAPEQRAKRQRADERRILTAELRSITAHRVYGYMREGTILKRLRVLDRADAPKPAVERRARLHAEAVERRAVHRVEIIEDDACLPDGWFPADIDLPRELAWVAR